MDTKDRTVVEHEKYLKWRESMKGQICTEITNRLDILEKELFLDGFEYHDVKADN